MTGPHRRPRGQVPCPVLVRFAPSELDAIRAAAARPGRRVAVARFIAEAAVAAAHDAPPVRPRAAPTRLALAEIAEATSAVSRIGNNLNQLARMQNTTHERPDGADAEVQRAQAALARLTDTVERAAGPGGRDDEQP